MIAERPTVRTYSVRGSERRPIDRQTAIVVSGSQTNPVLEHLGGRVEKVAARLAHTTNAKERRHCRRAIERLLSKMGSV